MTYLTFLLVFILPPIVLLGMAQPRPLAGVGGTRARTAIPLTCAIAFLYTTPWDNYLVWRGVWGYGTARVLGTLWYVPYEEYAFFILQPILTGLLLYLVLARHERRDALEETPSETSRWVGGLFFALLSLSGVWLLWRDNPAGTYLGLILAWAGPVVMGLWLYAGPHLWKLRRPLALTLTASTLYLWVADRTAIRLGIWDISNHYSFDLDPLGLPVEEAVFFLITNVLSIAGITLFLHGDRIPPPWRRPSPARASTR